MSDYPRWSDGRTTTLTERLAEQTREELLALRECTPTMIAATMRREGWDPETTSLETYARHKAAHAITIADMGREAEEET